MRPLIDGQGEAGVRDERLLPDGEPFPWMPLAMLTALGIVMRTIGLDSGLWYDEIRTLLDSVRSPLAKIVTVFPGDNQHTLFSILAHVSIAAFGDGQEARACRPAPPASAWQNRSGQRARSRR